MAIILSSISLITAIENNECFECHEDKDLPSEREGQVISLHVDKNKFTRSVHGDLTCDNCHEDLTGIELMLCRQSIIMKRFWQFLLLLYGISILVSLLRILNNWDSYNFTD